MTWEWLDPLASSFDADRRTLSPLKVELVENAEAIQKNILAANQANATGGAESTWIRANYCWQLRVFVAIMTINMGALAALPNFRPR